MPKKENFTAGLLSKLQCEPGKSQSIFMDAKSPGLGVRVTAQGAKSFIFETKLHGKTLRLTIGPLSAWPLDGPAGLTSTARAEAGRLKNLVNQGIDPRIEKRDRRVNAEAAAKAELNRSKFALDIWCDYVAARQEKWSKSHLADHLKVIHEGGTLRTRGRRPGESELTQPGALRALLHRPLCEVDAPLVKNWLRSETVRRPTHARLCFSLLRAFLNWCADQDACRALVHVDACAPRLAKQELPKKAAKNDCLQKEQLAAWFSETRKLPPVLAAYLQCVLLLGPRRNELTGLKWGDVDFKWGSLRIKDKLEGDRVVPLTRYTSQLLLNLKRINETPPPQSRVLTGKRILNDISSWKPSPFVFYSAASASGHIEEPSSAHRRALSAAGLPHISIHGLRRSFGTLSEWVECPAGIVAQIQGHKPSATVERHYRVRPLDLLRKWHQKIEDWILCEAGIAAEFSD